MTRFVLLAAFVLLSSTFLAKAQSSASTHNHAAAQDLIDGSQHPEQIPDNTAYRLVLLALSKPVNPNDSQSRSQQAQLGRVGLSGAERSALISILARFNSDYHALIQSYNATATAANARGERADINSFLVQRDQLVQGIHDQIKATLSADGWGQLDNYVQHEKKHMKVGRAEVNR